MNLNAQINVLKSTLRQRDATILKLTRELKEARRYIHVLTRSSDEELSEGEEMEVDDDEEEYDDDDDEAGSESHGEDATDEDIDALHQDDDGEESDLPQVLIMEDVYVCCSCGTEVLDGACHNYYCGMEHQWPPKDPLNYDYSLETESSATHTDRSLVPRGNTPTLDDDPSLPVQTIPDIYRPVKAVLDDNSRVIQASSPDRAAEYKELIRRGATRLMCETFKLEFTYEGGIYAWADETIFEEFSGPEMKQGHTWKIHLGRRIQLEEGDIDGLAFIEELLEDTVIFPAPPAFAEHGDSHGPWETKEETPGVWVTRQVLSKEPGDAVTIWKRALKLGIVRNEYSEADDEMDEVPDADAGLSEEDDYSTPDSQSSSSEEDSE